MKISRIVILLILLIPFSLLLLHRITSTNNAVDTVDDQNVKTMALNGLKSASVSVPAIMEEHESVSVFHQLEATNQHLQPLIVTPSHVSLAAGVTLATSPVSQVSVPVPVPVAQVSVQAPPAMAVTLVSLHCAVTSDVRGNLGPPSVVTDPGVTDWMTDRWQCESVANQPVCHLDCLFVSLCLHMLINLHRVVYVLTGG